MNDDEPCPAVLSWSGHPRGAVPCELDLPHERHRFRWIDDDGDWHEIEWTDALTSLFENKVLK